MKGILYSRLHNKELVELSESYKKVCENPGKRTQRIAYRKAQVSVEYVLVIGLVIVALTLIVAVAISYSSSAKHQIIMNQIEKVGKKIVETTDSVYYLGSPSKATIDLTMPKNIQSILINRTSKTVVFKFTGSTGDAFAIFYFRADIDDSVDQPLDTDTFKSAGLKHLVITALDDSTVNLAPAF